MGILGSGSIHMANRYAKKPAYRTANPATTVCQKCLQAGHWTYECKNTAVYQSRPTRTKQLMDPKYKPRFLAPGELLPEHRDKEPEEAAGKAKAAAKKKKKKPVESSSSNGSSSSSGDDSSSSSSSDDSSSSGDSSSSDSGSSSSGTSSDSSSESSSSDDLSSSDSEAAAHPPRKKARRAAEPAPAKAKSRKDGEKAAKAVREPEDDHRERGGERSKATIMSTESKGAERHAEERAVARHSKPKIRSMVTKA